MAATTPTKSGHDYRVDSVPSLFHVETSRMVPLSCFILFASPLVQDMDGKCDHGILVVPLSRTLHSYLDKWRAKGKIGVVFIAERALSGRHCHFVTAD
jgi:hypothetical protein